MEHPYPLGALVRKVNSEAEDVHKDGCLGVVCEPPPAVPKNVSQGKHYLAARITAGMQYFYFVDWGDVPIPVGVIGQKLEVIDETATA